MNKISLIKLAWIFNFFIVITHASVLGKDHIPDPEKVLEQVLKSPRLYCKEIEPISLLHSICGDKSLPGITQKEVLSYCEVLSFCIGLYLFGSIVNYVFV